MYSYFSYLGPFWIVGLFSSRNRNRVLRFHMNQGMVLFISELVVLLAAWLTGNALGAIPYAGTALKYAMRIAAAIYFFVMSVKGMSNVSKNKEKRLPLIGRIEILK